MSIKTNLAKYAGGRLYDVILGSPAQVASGLATHSTLTSAVAAVPSGGNLYILKGTYSGNVTISTIMSIFGQGYGSQLTGQITLNSSANHCTIKDIRFSFVGTALTVDLGSTHHIIRDFFTDSGALVNDANASHINDIRGMGA